MSNLVGNPEDRFSHNEVVLRLLRDHVGKEIVNLLTVCSHCYLAVYKLSYFPLWFRGRMFVFGYFGS